MRKQTLLEMIFEVPRKSPRRRRWRTPRRNPLGMAGFTCHVLLPFWCAMAATAGEETYHFENTDLEMLQQVAGPELGKSIVPPEEIRRAVGRDSMRGSWLPKPSTTRSWLRRRRSRRRTARSRSTARGPCRCLMFGPGPPRTTGNAGVALQGTSGNWTQRPSGGQLRRSLRASSPRRSWRQYASGQ